MSNNELLKSKAKGRKSKMPDSKFLLMLYQNQTAAELAKEFNVAESTIRAWIKIARDSLNE